MRLTILFRRFFGRIALDYPDTLVIYVTCLVIDGKPWYYVGQATNAERRITRGHQSKRYRLNNPTLLCYLWEKASSVELFFAVDNGSASLASGPTSDIHEHWVATVFRALQPVDLKSSVAPETWDRIPSHEIQYGANVREPLAQKFKPSEWPGVGVLSLKDLPIEHKREYYKERQRRKDDESEQHHRREFLLNEDLYTGEFWIRNGLYGKFGFFYVFRIMNILFCIEIGTYRRWQTGTTRVKIELAPEGEVHPHAVVRGMSSPRR